jgi:hypothetical protein
VQQSGRPRVPECISAAEEGSMLRTALFVAMLALFACGGGQESDRPAEGTAPGAPARSAGAGAPAGQAAGEAAPAAPSQPAARQPAPDIETTRAVLMDPLVSECLDLIRESKYEEALPKCQEAGKKYPGNPEVEVAIEMAQLGGLGPGYED